MGLATARALAQAGRDVVVCEQFELGHDAWVEPRQLADRAPVLSGRALGPVRAGDASRSGASSRRRAAGACSSCTARSTSVTGSRTAMHSQRAGRRSRCSTRARSSSGSASAPIAGESGLFQADGGDRPCGRSRRGVRRRPRGARARPRRDGRRGRRRRHRGRRARAGGRRHRGRVGAGARGRGCDPHGGDRHLLRPRPADAVCHRHDDGRPPRLRARVARRLTEGRSASIGTPDGPRRARRPRPRALRPHRRLGRAPVSRRWAAGDDTETCLYTIRENDEFLLERRGRIVVGSPCSGHGFKFAPVVGQRLAALALEALE